MYSERKFQKHDFRKKAMNSIFPPQRKPASAERVLANSWYIVQPVSYLESQASFLRSFPLFSRSQSCCFGDAA
jgi:hypothetical protein